VAVITLRLTPEERTELRVLAASRNKSMEGFLRALVRRELDRESPGELPGDEAWRVQDDESGEDWGKL
jgi:plasmid stability protein